MFEPESWRFHCGCSRERVRAVLKAMSRDELEQILEEDGEISADCEFCNASYGFDSAVSQLLIFGAAAVGLAYGVASLAGRAGGRP